MKATDHHINNPTSIGMLNVVPMANMEKSLIVREMTQEEYDHIGNPDPYIAYVITDSVDGKVYLGRNLVRGYARQSYTFCMAPSDQKGEWDVLQVTDNGLELICTFGSFEAAGRKVRELCECGKVASLKERLYSAVENYVRYNLTLDESIIGCLVALGLRSDNPELQRLMSWLIMNEDRIHNRTMERQLDMMANKNPGSVAALYRDVFNWFLINDFFIQYARVEEDELMPIGEQLDDLQRIYAKWLMMG